MSIDMIIDLGELLAQVDGIEIKASLRGDSNIGKVAKELDDQLEPSDIGYAMWLLSAQTLIKFPGYEHWREYSVYPDGELRGVFINLNVGSASPFRAYITELCATYSIKMTEV